MSDLHTIEVEESNKNLLRILSGLPTSVLQSALGHETFDGLKSFGFGTDDHQIAKTLISIYGNDVFGIKEINESLCRNLNIDPFRWGRNRKSAYLLDNLGIDRSYLPDPAIRREPIIESISDSRLHKYQQSVKSALSRFLVGDNKQNSIMVQMPTGSGKTRVAMESIYDFLRLTYNQRENFSVIWLAHTDELCEQAVESFEMGWSKLGSFEVNLLRLWGGNMGRIPDIPDGINFAVISLQSAYSMMRTRNQHVEDLFTELRKNTKLLIIDEAHISKANTFESAINFLCKHGTKKIGLTATPGRHGLNSDNEETIELARFFEGNKIDISSEFGEVNAIDYLQNQGILSKVEQEPLLTNLTIKLNLNQQEKLANGEDLSQDIIKQVVNDEERNNTIIKHLQYLSKELNKKILVFAASVSHANMISAVLSATGIESRSITDKSSQQQRRAAIRDFKNEEFSVLCNFGVLSTGFDDPKINCVVIARPTFSVVLYSQMVGRGLRGIKNGGTEECLLVDVVDNLVTQPELKQAYNYFEGEWNG